MEVQKFESKNCIYMDSNLAYHPGVNKYLSFLLNKGNYLKKEPKKVNGIINIMRRHKTREVTLGAIRQLMEKSLTLNKFSKLFTRLNKIFKTAQAKGVFRESQSKPHEVKRITGIMPLSEQSYYNPSQVKPATYLSRFEGINPTFIVFMFFILG